MPYSVHTTLYTTWMYLVLGPIVVGELHCSIDTNYTIFLFSFLFLNLPPFLFIYI
ncbi:hypothetical protein F5X96DRAFT_620388 [Biscogniauxia mediterranea]|nr:hypothetical protein F5X96DRAFT_620388 [Biscogniauxia mediterranea]